MLLLLTVINLSTYHSVTHIFPQIVTENFHSFSKRWKFFSKKTFWNAKGSFKPNLARFLTQILSRDIIELSLTCKGKVGCISEHFLSKSRILLRYPSDGFLIVASGEDIERIVAGATGSTQNTAWSFDWKYFRTDCVMNGVEWNPARLSEILVAMTWRLF